MIYDVPDSVCAFVFAIKCFNFYFLLTHAITYNSTYLLCYYCLLFHNALYLGYIVMPV